MGSIYGFFLWFFFMGSSVDKLLDLAVKGAFSTQIFAQVDTN